jgi:hypothetical protein
MDRLLPGAASASGGGVVIAVLGGRRMPWEEGRGEIAKRAKGGQCEREEDK